MYLPVLIIFTTNPLRHFWKIWQIFSRTQILYLQDYIYEICSELTTFAVESPTGCINLPEEVLNYMNKNHAASDSLYVLPV